MNFKYLSLFNKFLLYTLPKLKHTTEEKDIWKDQPLFINIVTKDEENGGWKSDVRPLAIKDDTIQLVSFSVNYIVRLIELTEEDMPVVLVTKVN